MAIDFDVQIPGSWQYHSADGNVNLGGSGTARAGYQESAKVQRRKPKGWIPPTGYSLLHRTWNRAQGICKLTLDVDPNAGGTYTGLVGDSCFNSLNHFDQILLESDLTTQGLDDRSLTRALSQLKAQKVNLGVAFGERKQTARLLGDTASRLVRSIRQLRHGEIRGAMRTLGISADKRMPRGSNWTQKWLELQYGWKPALSDVYGAADALSKRPKDDWIVTVKSTVREKIARDYFFPSFDYGYGRARGEVGVFTRIDAFPENEGLISLASLGITNPLVIAWELVPFSFLADWILPIGGWLDSLDSYLGYEKAFVCQSRFIRCDWTEKGLGGTPPYFPGWTAKNAYAGSKRLVRLDRSVQNNFPIPAFPRIKDPRSLGHMANALALLAQVVGGKSSGGFRPR